MSFKNFQLLYLFALYIFGSSLSFASTQSISLGKIECAATLDELNIGGEGKTPGRGVRSDQIVEYVDFLETHDRFFRRYLNSRLRPGTNVEIDDVMQVAAIKLFRNWNKFEGRSGAQRRTWATTIYFNELQMFIRSEKPHLKYLDRTDALGDEGDNLTALDRALRDEGVASSKVHGTLVEKMAEQEKLIITMTAIDRLESPFKDILMLRYFGTRDGSAVELFNNQGYDPSEKLSDAEIAAVTGKTVGATKSQAFRALSQVKDYVRFHYEARNRSRPQ